MSVGRTSLAIIIPTLVAALAQHACATAEDLDQEALRLIQEGKLVATGNTTSPSSSTSPANTQPPINTVPVTNSPADPSNTGAPTGSGMPTVTNMPVEPAPPVTVPSSTTEPTTPATPTAPAPTVTDPGGAGGAPGMEPEPGGTGATDGTDAGGVDPMADAGVVTPDPVPDVPQEILDATDLALYYRGSSGATISFSFWIANLSTEQAPRLDEITVRYWYTSDDVPFQLMFDHKGDWVKDATATPDITPDGREYIEFAYPSTERIQRPTMENHTILQVRMPETFDPPTPYVQSDDWSYDATAMLTQTHDRMTIYRRGALVWGEEPPPLD